MSSTKKLILAFLFLVVTLYDNPLSSQEAPDSQYEELNVTLAAPLIVMPDEPSAVRAKFSEVIENVDGQLSTRTIVGLDKVEIEGVLSAEAQGQMRNDGTLSKRDLERLGGNITWNAVSLTEEEETKRALLPSPLLSNVNVEQNEIPAGSTVAAQGDVNGAIQTAKELLSNTTPEEEIKEQEKEEKTDQPATASPSVGGGSSGGGEEGGQLGQTKSYDIDPVTEEPAPVLGTTTQGCKPIPLVAQGIVQETSQLTTNGVPDGNCTPTGTEWTLQKGYSSCTDEIVTGEMKAYARFKLYYVSTSGETVYVDANGKFVSSGDESACQRDKDTSFTMYEDESKCTDDVNYNLGIATPQSRLVYENKKNEIVVVQECRVLANTTPISFYEDPAQCQYRIDPVTNKAIPQAETYYVNSKGVRVKVEECKDAKSFTATDLFEETGQCGYDIDAVNGQAIPLAETFYKNRDGAKIKVADCHVMEGAARATLYEDPTQCQYRIDPDTGKAIPQAETYYTNASGAKVKVEDCKDAKTLTSADLFEEAGSCEYRVDSVTGQAIPQAATYYINRAGAKIEVEGCHDQGGVPTALLFEDPSQCQYRLDPVLNKAIPQAETYYLTMGGTKVKVEECKDATSLSSADLFEEASSCGYRVDKTNGVAIPQVETFYMNLSGAKIKIQDCHDQTNAITANLFEDPAQCDFNVDPDTNEVVPYAETYYLTGEGNKIKVEDCSPAKTVEKPILLEDFNACKPRTDLVTNQAIPQSQLYYIRGTSQRVTFSDCSDSKNATSVPIYETSDICGIRDDFNIGKSVQLTRKVYEINGVINQVTPCADSTTTYDHEVVRNVCPDITDWANESGPKRIEQIRYRITTPLGQMFVTSCLPDTSRTFDIVETTEGCLNEYKHDLLSGQSIGTSRFYYVDNNKRQYLNGGTCSDDPERTYPHQIRITGYEDHDDLKFSYPEIETYIDTEAGKIVVQASQVGEDAIPMPYTYSRTIVAPTGEIEYEGCNKFTKMASTEYWTKPNGNEASYIIGAAPSVGPDYDCQTFGASTVGDWTLIDDGTISRFANVEQVCISSPETECNVASITSGTSRECIWQATRNTVRGDGEPINTVPLEMKLPRSNYSIVNGDSGVNGYCGSGPSWPNGLNWGCALSLGWVVPDIQCEPHPTTDEVAAKLAE